MNNRLILCIVAFYILFFSFQGSKGYAQEDEYLIGVEDVLHISVWENDRLNNDVIVRPDGKISFPLIDDLKVAGFTPLEIKKIITEKLSSFVKNPVVMVMVQSINHCKVYVLGSVDSPGAVILKSKTNLLQLLAMVGGHTLVEKADLQNAYILRGQERLSVNFERLLDKGDIDNVDLISGDIIFIPDNFDKRITIVGEVLNPRTISFKKGITVLDAVIMAGGATEDAKLNATKIIRKSGDQEKTIQVKLKDIMKKGKIKSNFILKEKDVIIVPARII